MPHCQKENHDHRSKSKKERQKKKEAALAKKKALKEKEEEEEEKAKLSNNIALAEGFGDYEVGCEAEREYVAKFNMKKRSKKHLRIDIRKQQEKKEREEAERLKREQEEKYRLEQEKLKEQAKEEEEEEEVEPITEEYLVYICLCCHKKFLTANSFQNHINSKKHRANAALYEEAGVICTEVHLLEDFDEDEFSYDGEEVHEIVDESDNEDEDYSDSEEEEDDEDGDDDDDDDESEDDFEPRKGGTSLFTAFGALSESESSSSESSDDEDEEKKEKEEEEEKKSQSNVVSINNPKDSCEENDASEDEYDDDLDLLEEIIFQNRLQERFYPEDETNKEDETTKEVVPVDFDEDQYDPDNFNKDQSRLAAVQYRLQKRLAAKGIKPSEINPCYRTSDAVSMSKTLLQQVMEASIDTLETKLAEYKRHKEEYQLLGREFRFAKGNSKAISSQYTFRIDPADNQRRRENIHHTGSHYHMQAARSMQFGRRKGMMARHSNQGARLQASRMAAKEMQRIHGKGMKIGKTSKKSQQKRRGEAGGSKKTGGVSTSEK